MILYDNLFLKIIVLYKLMGILSTLVLYVKTGGHTFDILPQYAMG